MAHDYDLERLDADRRLIRITFGVMLVPTVGFVGLDAFFVGSSLSALAPFLALRAAILVALGGGIVLAGRAVSRAQFERAVASALTVCLAALVLLRFLRPSDSVLSTYFEILAIVGLYSAIPLPLRTIVAVNTGFSTALIAITLGWTTNTPLPERVAIAVVVVLANVFGWVIARNRQGLLGRLTLAHRQQAEALAELRTLRGIIPVCSSCSSVRVNDSEWQALQSYVSAHTHAEFSHGICPGCAAALYPGFTATAEMAIP